METRSTRERGQTIVLLAVALVALIAFVGLATDAALVYLAKARLQRAIDATALAAANKLPKQDEARAAAYEFARLHGYEFDHTSHPLHLGIDFPIVDPPRKIAHVVGTVDVDLAFLKIIGWQTTQVRAEGTGESAPLDVYLVLDLSASMWYDTAMPWEWSHNNSSWRRAYCPLSVCNNTCIANATTSWDVCAPYYCNTTRTCNPLDAHVKPAADYFVDQLDSRYDRIGVVAYDEQAFQAIHLTDDFGVVKTTIGGLNAYQTNAPSTNIGDAIVYADHYLSLPPPADGGEGGRLDSVWAIVLLTDGAPTCWRDCPTCTLHCASPICGTCENYAYSSAQSSWNAHRITIYSICYGDRCSAEAHYRSVMIKIADITDNGKVEGSTDNFWLAPDEAGLKQALEEIARRIYTRLIQ
jgi:hypothetical protein